MNRFIRTTCIYVLTCLSATPHLSTAESVRYEFTGLVVDIANPDGNFTQLASSDPIHGLFSFKDDPHDFEILAPNVARYWIDRPFTSMSFGTRGVSFVGNSREPTTVFVSNDVDIPGLGTTDQIVFFQDANPPEGFTGLFGEMGLFLQGGNLFDDIAMPSAATVEAWQSRTILFQGISANSVDDEVDVWVVAEINVTRAIPNLSSRFSLLETISTTEILPAGPDGIALDPIDQQLLLVDSENSEIVRMTLEGEFVSSFPTEEGFPEGIHVTSDGTIWVSDETQDGITTYSADGLPHSFVSLEKGTDPTGVVVDEENNSILVSDDTASRVFEFSSAGELISELDTTVFGALELEGIEIDPSTGNMFVVDDRAKNVYEFSRGGRLLGILDLLELTPDLRDPEGLAYDAENKQLYVSFDNNDVIAVFGLPLLGDLDRNGTLDAGDLDTFSLALRTGELDKTFDLNQDGQVDPLDRQFMVENLMNTYFGDSNLDGEFNTRDFVLVFTEGQFEDEIEDNSVWSTGDWNGDGDFDTGDFVLAFQRNGFEKGPRITLVPETHHSIQTIVILAFLLTLRIKGPCS